MNQRRQRLRARAAEAHARGDIKAWFEDVYQDAAGEAAAIPWADLEANPLLVEACPTDFESGCKALVVACGLGDDAEFLAARGFEVTAFEISQTAVDWCQKRFPESAVRYQQADLFALPEDYRGGFDFVFEANTLQVLPAEARAAGLGAMLSCLRPGGRLLLCARGREAHEPEGQLPWPLLKTELTESTPAGFTVESFEDLIDSEDPPVRRFRVCYQAEP